MKRFGVAAFFVLALPYAGAQTPSSPQAAVIPPRPLGPPHACDAFNPEGETAGRPPATVQFRITKEGTVADPVIGKSSGNETLDQAAISCMLTWKYEPARRNGEAVDFPWTAVAQWRVRDGVAPFVDRYPALREQCLRAFPLAADEAVPGPGITELLIRVGNGAVHGKIVRSSGNAKRDRNAIACVKSWDVSNLGGLLPPFEVDWRKAIRAEK